mmetsp:Transcript_13416/g.23134  ORF Transcript_13416/g.23134 Transcript_13416/m.23134 type:complete len:110 (-) Transcript_13416:191-520(-)
MRMDAKCRSRRQSAEEDVAVAVLVGFAPLMMLQVNQVAELEDEAGAVDVDAQERDRRKLEAWKWMRLKTLQVIMGPQWNLKMPLLRMMWRWKPKPPLLQELCHQRLCLL